mmetsp:Transcript_16829/g.32561  ORF Transcript_16829/g.32561 Transcript_16829/m.32561 type:complete len:201 (+) Transcript_16829:3775-4377(+)
MGGGSSGSSSISTKGNVICASYVASQHCFKMDSMLVVSRRLSASDFSSATGRCTSRTPLSAIAAGVDADDVADAHGASASATRAELSAVGFSADASSPADSVGAGSSVARPLLFSVSPAWSWAELELAPGLVRVWRKPPTSCSRVGDATTNRFLLCLLGVTDPESASPHSPKGSGCPIGPFPTGMRIAADGEALLVVTLR